MTKSFEDVELIDPLHLIFIPELEEECKIYHFLDFCFFQPNNLIHGQKDNVLKK